MSDNSKVPKFMIDLGFAAQSMLTRRLSDVRIVRVDHRVDTLHQYQGRDLYLRDRSCQVIVRPVQLKDTGIELGSAAFFHVFVDPVVYALAEDIREASFETDEGLTAYCGSFPEKVQHTAPYHWHVIIEFNNLHLLVYTFVADGNLVIRYQVRLAVSEKTA